MGDRLGANRLIGKVRRDPREGGYGASSKVA